MQRMKAGTAAMERRRKFGAIDRMRTPMNDIHKLSSCAILDAMFLNPIEVPEILLKRTPFRLRRGSLQT